MFQYPHNYHISSGAGYADTSLVSFDKALISSGISNYNLLRVSSILPSECVYSERINVKYGSPLLVAYGTITSNIENTLIASAIAIGIPVNNSDVGVIMECAGNYDAIYAERMAKQMVFESMFNHGIECKDVLCSSVEIKCKKGKYASVISAVSMW